MAGQPASAGARLPRPNQGCWESVTVDSAKGSRVGLLPESISPRWWEWHVVPENDNLSLTLRSEHRSASLREMLHKPATALLGISPDAAAALDSLAIVSIFDLATSPAFDD